MFCESAGGNQTNFCVVRMSKLLDVLPMGKLKKENGKFYTLYKTSIGVSCTSTCTSMKCWVTSVMEGNSEAILLR